jgi:biopolymer transport protein ExbD
MSRQLFIYLPVWSFAGVTACLIAFGIWQTERIDKRLADVQLPTASAPDVCCMMDKQPALVLVEKNGNYNFLYRGNYHNLQWEYTFSPSPDSTRETDYLNYGPVFIYADRDIPGTVITRVTDQFQANGHRVYLLIRYKQINTANS